MLRLTALLFATSVAVAAPVPKAAKSQLLVVTVDAKTGKSQLVLIDADGQNPKELTDTESNASYPAWSPDGKQIAFSSDRGGGAWHVFVMDADGTNVKKLSRDDDCGARVPSWSPDGKRIAYCRRGPGGDSDVLVVDAADGKNPTVIGDGDAWEAAFSPDWSRLAFVSFRDNSGLLMLYTMAADGSKVAKVNTDGNATQFGHPCWKPDGKTIAFSLTEGEATEIHAVDADGKNPARLTTFGGYSVYPAFSPDGKKLAFVQYKPGEKAELILADADGKNPKAILKDFTTAEGGRPAWRPK